MKTGTKIVHTIEAFSQSFPAVGVHEREYQGHQIHARQQDYADEGQNPFTFIVFHSSFSIEESFLS